jgi:large subunit ribosomal protein L21
MFAVVKTGGKQYRVSPGDVILVEKLLGNSGDTVTLSDVLMVVDGDKSSVGAPVLAGAAVEATIREQTRGDKVIVFKKKRRQGYRRKKGHRQDLTVLAINNIVMDGKKAASAQPKAEKKAVAAEKTEKAPKKEVAPKPKKEAAASSEGAVAEAKPKKATAKAKKEA